MARKTIPITECVEKRLTICSKARINLLKVQMQLKLKGLPSSEGDVINYMLREYSVK